MKWNYDIKGKEENGCIPEYSTYMYFWRDTFSYDDVLKKKDESV